MTKCKLCKTNIPDGAEYCENCIDKTDAKANESYLDSLLSTVKNSAPTTESIYKKRSNTEISNQTHDSEPDSELKNDDFFDFNIGDIEDFDQFDINEDLIDLKEDVIISDKDLFGDDLSELFSDDDTDQDKEDTNQNQGIDHIELGSEYIEKGIDPIQEESDYIPKESDFRDEETDNTQQGLNLDQVDTDQVEDDIVNYEDNIEQMGKDNLTQFTDNADEIETDSFTDDNLNLQSNENQIAEDTLAATNVNQNEINDFSEENNYDSDLNDLLNQLDDSQSENEVMEDIPTIDNAERVQDEINSLNNDIGIGITEETHQDEEEDDFLSLLNQISGDDPVADDVKAINDLMNGVPAQPSMGSGMPSDVGEVFSDALKVVSNLNDPNIDEVEILSKVSGKKDKKAKKAKKVKKSNKAGKNQNEESTEEKPKVSLFKKLFGNVEDKNTAKKAAASKKSSDNNAEIIELTKEKPKKAKKAKKGKEAQGSEGSDEANTDKEGVDTKKAKKKGKKEKKQKSTSVIQVIDEIEEDVGRINRLGASIVFVFFGLMALLIYVGSNAVSYTLSIQHATTYFDKRKYTEAYEEVYGINIDDEDVEIYSKIMTVMFVNKQLNSYNNYCTLKNYPKALDSLLKGIKRYDKYIELAKMLGIKTDMDYVREQIFAELKNEFSLSEKDALNIINIEDMNEYSTKVFEVAQGNEIVEK